MPTNQHNYILFSYYYLLIMISLGLVVTVTTSNLSSSEMKSNSVEVINNTPEKPLPILEEQYLNQNPIDNQPQIRVDIPKPLKKNPKLLFKDCLIRLLKHSQTPFLMDAPHQIYDDHPLIQTLKDLNIHHLQDFLKDVHNGKSKILEKLNNYPKLKQLTRFIADNWYLLINTNQLLVSYLAKKYQLSQKEVSLLRNEVYHPLATMLYLSKQKIYYPTPLKEKLQKAQQELFNILKLSEQLYCKLGKYDPYIIQAIADNKICSNLPSIKKAILQENQNPLIPYYQDDQEAFKRISTLTDINELPTLSCQNYLSGLFPERLAEELSAIYYQNTKKSSEKDREKLIAIVDDNFISENDIDETLDNLNNLNNPDNIDYYLDEDEQLFCQEENIKQSLEGYKQLLMYYRKLATQIDEYLYNITSNEKYQPGAPIYFFEKPKSIYLIRYFKNLFSSRKQEKIGSLKLILQKNNLLDPILTDQLMSVLTYSLDLQSNKTLQEWIAKQYNLTNKEQKIIQHYTFYESCSRLVPTITTFGLSILFSNLEDPWERYISATKWLRILTIAWANMEYPYHPQHFLPLITNDKLMKKLPLPPSSYQRIKKLLANHFEEIKQIYRDTPNNNKLYILTGMRKILANRNENYLTKYNIILPFLHEYSSLDEYFYSNTHKIAYLLIKTIFPHTYSDIVAKIAPYSTFGEQNLYSLRKEIQRNQSPLLTHILQLSFWQKQNRKEAKEEIVKRFNTYIEAVFLLKNIIFGVNQALNHNDYFYKNCNSITKYRIEALKNLLNSLLEAARSTQNYSDLFRNPSQYYNDIVSKIRHKLVDINEVLENLDLICYRKMLSIILSMNHEIAWLDIKKYQEKFWEIIKGKLTTRSPNQKIILAFQNLTKEISQGIIKSVTNHISVDKKIITQYINLLEQYLITLDLLYQSGISKQQLTRLALPILQQSAKQCVNQNANTINVKDIFSITHIKLLVKEKRGLQFIFSQKDWKKIQNLINPKREPIPYYPKPITYLANQNNIHHNHFNRRNFNVRKNASTDSLSTSKLFTPYQVNFDRLKKSQDNINAELILSLNFKKLLEKRKLASSINMKLHELIQAYNLPIYNCFSEKALDILQATINMKVINNTDRTIFEIYQSVYGKMKRILNRVLPGTDRYCLIKTPCKHKTHIILYGRDGMVYQIAKQKQLNNFTCSLKQVMQNIDYTVYTPPFARDEWILSCIQKWNKELYTQNKSVTDLLSLSIITHYWEENKSFLFVPFLATNSFKQILEIQSFDMFHHLLHTYTLAIEKNCQDLYIRSLDQQYLIIGVSEVNMAGTLFFFKKGKKKPLYSLGKIDDLHSIVNWTYSPQAKILFIPSSEDLLNAYILHDHQLEKINNQEQIKGQEAIILLRKKGYLLNTITIGYQERQYQLHSYQITHEHHKFTIQKNKHISSFNVPKNTLVDNSHRFRFRFFSSPLQPDYLFILTLEKLLVIQKKVGAVVLTIPILLRMSSYTITLSNDGIVIPQNPESIYSLTWEEFKKITTKHQ